MLTDLAIVEFHIAVDDTDVRYREFRHRSRTRFGLAYQEIREIELALGVAHDVYRRSDYGDFGDDRGQPEQRRPRCLYFDLNEVGEGLGLRAIGHMQAIDAEPKGKRIKSNLADGNRAMQRRGHPPGQ